MEAQANEKLQHIYQQLLQAGVDQHESEKEAKLKETLANLQRLFPGQRIVTYIRHSIYLYHKGVRGRVVDLCKPSQRKYDTAVSVVLGRNTDSVVVDEERTAIDCIEVCSLPP